jgi:hypothetical protein
MNSLSSRRSVRDRLEHWLLKGCRTEKLITVLCYTLAAHLMSALDDNLHALPGNGDQVELAAKM